MILTSLKRHLKSWKIFTVLSLMTCITVLGVPSVYSQGTPTVKIDGSSTVYPITEAVAEDFQKQVKNSIQVTVGVSGTGGGFKKFCDNQTDISNASRPIKESERKKCKEAGVSYIELPVAFDALTIVINPKNTWAKDITVAELKKLWEPAATGKITRWNQIRSSWPDAPIKLFGPGADSGTFDYFTEAIVGESKKSRTDYTPSEDDNIIIQGVSRERNALGYFGFAYYEANKKRIKALPVNGGKGAVMPSSATVINNTYQPLSRPIFIYVNSKSAQRSEVKRFVEYYLANAAKLVKEVKYVPLPAKAYQIALQHFKQPKLGSVFVGRDTVGVTIEELMQLESKD